MGRKRTINQSTCNKDYSCLKGFCPSFVTIDGGKLRRRAPPDLGNIGDLPEPVSRPSLERPYNIAVGGVGGTGVLTIGALLGMAAHIEGKASMILDMSGLAQKGGAVLSHVRLSEHTADVTCSRIVTGNADLVLAADDVAAADPARLAAMMKGQDDTVAPKTLDTMSLDEIIAHRSALLTNYQNAALAERYRKLVGQVREAALNGGFGDALPRAVAINYAKL